MKFLLFKTVLYLLEITPEPTEIKFLLFKTVLYLLEITPEPTEISKKKSMHRIVKLLQQFTFTNKKL